MPSFTAQELIDRASFVADMQDDFVPAPAWLSWLRTESIALDIFLARSGYTQTIQSVSQVMTGANPSISIGGDLLAVVGVWEEVNGRYRQIAQRNPVDFLRQNPDTGTATGPATGYTVRSAGKGLDATDEYTVALWPRPTSGTYVVAILPATLDVTPQLSDNVNYPNGYEERIVLGMARRAIIKEESDTQAVDKLIREWDQTIEEAMWQFTWGEAPAVRNVDRLARGWSATPGYPPPSVWYWI